MAEIKGNIREIEIYPSFTVEWRVIAMKTGVFNDLRCKVTDDKLNVSHYNMDMTGIIEIL